MKNNNKKLHRIERIGRLPLVAQDQLILARLNVDLFVNREDACSLVILPSRIE